MQNQKDQKDIQQREIEQIFISRQIIETSPSQTYKDKYIQYFHNISEKLQNKNSLIQKLKLHNIIYQAWEKSHRFQISVVNTTLNYQISTLIVKLGSFTFNITIYNSSQKNYTHFLQGKASTFASIYTYRQQQIDAVIKCISYKQEKFLHTLITTIKQYCLLKIAAAIQVGPQIPKVFGFDLLIYDDCIQFAMQRCKPLPVVTDKMIEIIKIKLHRLHLLKFMHIDIKPLNFCFSTLSNEPIFIDFGLSQLIDENPGQYTNTVFMGSLSYCSPEMSRLYHISSNGPVQLYNNDIISLQKSLIQMRQQIIKQKQRYNEYDDSDDDIQICHFSNDIKKVTRKYKLLLIKYYIYNYHPINQWYNYYREIIKLYKFKIIQLIQNLPYSIYIQNIYSKFNNDYQLDFQKGYSFKQINHKTSHQLLDRQSSQSQDQQQNKVENRIMQMSKGYKIIRTNLCHKNIQQDIQINIFLFNQQYISQTSQYIYFQKFMLFTDFRMIQSTISQRKNAAIIFIKFYKLDIKEQYISLMCICWKFILYSSLKQLGEGYFYTILSALNNLIITQSISTQQFLQILKMIIQLQIQSIIKLQLLYNCSSSIHWYDHLIILSNRLQFKIQFNTIIVQYYNKFKQNISSQIIQLITTITLIGQHLHSKQIINLYHKIHKLKYIFNYQTYQNIKIYLQYYIFKYIDNNSQFINYQQQILYIQSLNIIHFKLLQSISQINNSIIIPLSNKIQSYFINTNILQQYNIYYFIPIKQQPKILQQTILLKSIYSIIPSLSYNYLFIIILLSKCLSQRYFSPQSISQLKNIINFQFICKVLDHQYPPFVSFQFNALLPKLITVFNQIHKHQSYFEQQVNEVIFKFSQKCDQDTLKINGKTQCLILTSSLASINRLPAATNITWEAINSNLISKYQKYELLDNICYLHREQKYNKTRLQQFVVQLYNKIINLNNWKLLFYPQIYIYFDYLNKYLLINNKRQFINLHLYIWRGIKNQQQYTNNYKKYYINYYYLSKLFLQSNKYRIYQLYKIINQFNLNFYQFAKYFKSSNILVYILPYLSPIPQNKLLILLIKNIIKYKIKYKQYLIKLNSQILNIKIKQKINYLKLNNIQINKKQLYKIYKNKKIKLFIINKFKIEIDSKILYKYYRKILIKKYNPSSIYHQYLNKYLYKIYKNNNSITTKQSIKQ